MSASAGKENTEPDDINVGLVATVAVVGAFLVLAIALTITALVRSEFTSHGNEAGTYADLGTVHRLKAEQLAKLTAAPSYVDKAKGQVALPIDRAMELVTADLKKDPTLATGAPVASAAPSAAAPVGAGGGAPDTTVPTPEKSAK